MPLAQGLTALFVERVLRIARICDGDKFVTRLTADARDPRKNEPNRESCPNNQKVHINLNVLPHQNRLDF
jgi:hypothetical protein